MTPTLTATYAAILAFFYVAMSAYVIVTRARTSVLLGDAGNPTMLVATRRHGNMAEYAPLALLMMVLAEMLGTGPGWLHAAGLLLIAGRVAHPLGIHSGDGTDIPRIAGMLATFAAILIPATAILFLTLA